MKLKDVRRKKNPLYENDKRCLTALNFRANMLADCKPSADKITLPILVDIPVDEPADEDDPGDVVDEPAEGGVDLGPDGVVVPMKSTQVNEWLCSYRSNEPEKKEFAAWRVRFTRMRAR